MAAIQLLRIAVVDFLNHAETLVLGDLMVDKKQAENYLRADTWRTYEYSFGFRRVKNVVYTRYHDKPREKRGTIATLGSN